MKPAKSFNTRAFWNPKSSVEVLARNPSIVVHGPVPFEFILPNIPASLSF